MKIEYEAKFLKIDKNEIRQKLERIGARMVHPEFFQKRSVFHLPKEKRSADAWLRVRDEGSKITLSLKIVDGEKIENQKEIMLTVDDFTQAELLLISIGCEKKAYQVTKREIWELDGVELMIDEWPFLEPFVEVEGKSEHEVKTTAERIGFDYRKAIFGAVGTLYEMKYGVSLDFINNKLKELTFDMKNPFI